MRRARAAGTKTNSCGVWRLRSAADWGDPRGPVRPGRHIARNADTWSSCIATPPPRRPSHVQSSLQETGMMQSGFRLPRPVLLGPLSEPPPNSSLQPVSTGFGLAWRASPDVPCRHSWRHSSGRLSPVQHFPLPPRLQKSSSCLQNGPDPSRRSPIFISLSPFLSTPSPARPAFSNPRMSLKSVRVEKGRLQGENLLSERIEMFERGGGQGGGGS